MIPVNHRFVFCSPHVNQRLTFYAGIEALPLPDSHVRSVLGGALSSTVEASPETTSILIFYQPEYVMNFLDHWKLRIQMNTKIKKGFGGSKRMPVK